MRCPDLAVLTCFFAIPPLPPCNELLWVLAVVTGQTLYMHTHTGYNTGKANYKSNWSGLVTVLVGRVMVALKGEGWVEMGEYVVSGEGVGEGVWRMVKVMMAVLEGKDKEIKVAKERIGVLCKRVEELEVEVKKVSREVQQCHGGGRGESDGVGVGLRSSGRRGELEGVGVGGSVVSWRGGAQRGSSARSGGAGARSGGAVGVRSGSAVGVGARGGDVVGGSVVRGVGEGRGGSVVATGPQVQFLTSQLVGSPIRVGWWRRGSVHVDPPVQSWSRWIGSPVVVPWGGLWSKMEQFGRDQVRHGWGDVRR